MPDWHEDRDSAWLLGLADAVAAELVTTRAEALTCMAVVFGGAAAGTGGSFRDSPFAAARTIVDLARIGELSEHLAQVERDMTASPAAAGEPSPAAVHTDEVGTTLLPGMDPP
jgi:hypothetical protein